MIVLANLLLLSVSIGDNSIFCPDSRQDNEEYIDDNDFGLNIYAQSSGSYADDCYIRYSRMYKPNTSIILNDFINPSFNTIVISHGWSPNISYIFDGTHSTTEQWNATINGDCRNYIKVNPNNNPEPCPPTDHDAKYWTQNGFNFIMLDWRQYANTNLKEAEAKIYQPVYNGKSVVELLYDKLKTVLDAVSWNGNELRFAGHSLGSQVVLNLASKWKLEAETIYANKLTRIALLDAYMSAGKKEYLQIDPLCIEGLLRKCEKTSNGEYARDVLLPNIRSGNNPAVIENYKTSSVQEMLRIFGSRGNEYLIDDMTVFVRLKPLYYGNIEIKNIVKKHLDALSRYIHCMKFSGDLNNNAPNCRMDTSYLKNSYCPSNGINKCSKHFEQNEDDAAYTTWDTDDTFIVITVTDTNDIINIHIHTVVVVLGVVVVLLLMINNVFVCYYYNNKGNNYKVVSFDHENEENICFNHQ